MASVSSSGAQGDFGSHGPTLSADGSVVAFNTFAGNLVDGDTNGDSDVFVRNLIGGTTERVSVSTNGAEGDGDSGPATVSADGRFVAFSSSSTNLVSDDTNNDDDIFLRDRLKNTTTRISVTSNGAQATGDSYINFSSGISADGRYVVYQSNSTDLVSGDTNGLLDVFVRDTVLNTTSRVSVSSSETEAVGGNSSNASISADGRYVAFYSDATNLVAGDTNGVSDVFVRDLLLGTTTRVSVDANGAESTGASNGGSLSADGKFISFVSSATNLVAGDTNGIDDLFVKNLESGEIRRVSTSSTGVESNGSSYTSAISADGRFVVFDSDASNLVSGDTNVVGDIFVRDLSVAGVQQMAGMVVSNQSSAKITLDLSKRYQSELSSYRAGIGIAMSRLGVFANALSVSSENYGAAASRVMDADIAEESAGLVANKIKQQAATSVLAQANQQPALALRLLSE